MTALDTAKGLLRHRLAFCAASTAELERLAVGAGVSWRTLQRAKTALGVQHRRVGGIAGDGHWVWYLPNLAKVSAPPLTREQREHLRAERDRLTREQLRRAA